MCDPPYIYQVVLASSCSHLQHILHPLGHLPRAILRSCFHWSRSTPRRRDVAASRSWQICLISPSCLQFGMSRTRTPSILVVHMERKVRRRSARAALALGAPGCVSRTPLITIRVGRREAATLWHCSLLVETWVWSR